MLQRITIAMSALVISAPTAPAMAEFVPDPSAPPIITQGTGTRKMADGYIPIPNPPKARSIPTQTRQQCLNLIHQMRVDRQRRGMSIEESSRIWARQVKQCDRLPKTLRGVA